MELVLSELKVIWWVELKDNCNCGKTGFWALHRHKKTGVCLRLLLKGMYSGVNPSLALCFSLFIYQGCHGDEGGLSWRTIISRELVWMWHVLFNQALFRCWFTCICFTLSPPPPHLQQRRWRQTFKGSTSKFPRWTDGFNVQLDWKHYNKCQKFKCEFFFTYAIFPSELHLQCFFFTSLFETVLIFPNSPPLFPPSRRSYIREGSNHRLALFPIPLWLAC